MKSEVVPADNAASWYKPLLVKAERYASEPHASVLDGARQPPGADPQDYVSLAPYWWPNPETTDGLPYVRRDGEVNPEARTEDLDYSAKCRMVERVEVLAFGAFYSDRPRLASVATQQINVWFIDPKTRMNPHLEHAQFVPGINSGRCFGIIEWVDLGRVLAAVNVLQDQDAMPASTAEGLSAWLAEYAEWLLTSETGQMESQRVNNHGTWYDVQAVTLLLHLGRKDDAVQRLEAAKQLRIAAQIEPDGRQPYELDRTKSLSYSRMNLTAFHRLAELGESVGVDLRGFSTPDGRSIRAAEAFLEPYLRGESDWEWPQL